MRKEKKREFHLRISSAFAMFFSLGMATAAESTSPFTKTRLGHAVSVHHIPQIFFNKNS